MQIIKKKSKNEVTYSFGKYKVNFNDVKKEKNSIGRNICNIEMLHGSDRVWSLYYFYDSAHATFGDLIKGRNSKTESIKATVELDFLFYCLSKNLKQKRIKTISGTTNPRFGAFLEKQGYRYSAKERAITAKITSLGKTKKPLLVRRKIK